MHETKCKEQAMKVDLVLCHLVWMLRCRHCAVIWLIKVGLQSKLNMLPRAGLLGHDIARAIIKQE